MLSSFASGFFHKRTDSLSEFVFVSTYESVVFFAVQVEVELRNRHYTKCCSNILGFLHVHLAEHNLRILVYRCYVFENWFKAHARTTTWRPKVDDYGRLLLDKLLQVRQRADLHHFAELGLRHTLWLLSQTSHASHSLELLEHLCHLVHVGLATTHARHAHARHLHLFWWSLVQRLNMTILCKKLI